MVPSDFASGDRSIFPSSVVSLQDFSSVDRICTAHTQFSTAKPITTRLHMLAAVLHVT